MESVLDGVELVENVKVVPESAGVTVPEMDSDDWTPFILCELRDGEIFNGRPTVDGLRRVTRKYFGEVVESVSNVVNYDGKRACVVHTLGIKQPTAQVFHFSGTADASPDNSDKPYNLYPSALAETRAEGRAYKRALQLENVLMADEIAQSQDDTSDAKIDDAKIDVINYMCKYNNINVLKLLAKGEKKYEKISDIPYDKGNIIVGYLNDVKHGKAKLPPDIIGYDQNWKVTYETRGTINEN